MNRLLKRADDVLRGRPTRPPWLLVIFCGAIYGAVMGGYGGLEHGRLWQMIFGAIKVPLLLVATLGLSLPSFFIANTLLGLRDDFSQTLRAIVASQAGLALVLVALAPITLLWYASFNDYNSAILFNAFIFASASVAAQFLLRLGYGPLIARNKRHKRLLYIWIGIYAFVGIQLGWTLRPFIGAPDQPATFFRLGQTENAYVVVARLIGKAIIYR